MVPWNLILTLTINPAIDRAVSVDKLVFEDRGYILSREEAAGGRGVNASQVIHSFGGKTLALLTAGGKGGERMEKSLARMGFPYETVRVKAETRINLNISDRQGLTIKLNEVGAALEPHELKAVRARVEAQIGKAKTSPVSWLMLCGSVPPGVPSSFYGDLIEMARSRGVQTLLDTDGPAAERAIEARPTIVSPNQQEAERLTGRALITRSQALEAVDRILAMGAESVLLSLGSRGALGINAEGCWEALPPRVDALCPIGAGDALAAAFVWGRSKKKAFYDSLRWAVAAGTAAAVLPGIQFPTFAQTRAMYKQVDVKPAR